MNEKDFDNLVREGAAKIMQAHGSRTPGSQSAYREGVVDMLAEVGMCIFDEPYDDVIERVYVGLKAHGAA